MVDEQDFVVAKVMNGHPVSDECKDALLLDLVYDCAPRIALMEEHYADIDNKINESFYCNSGPVIEDSDEQKAEIAIIQSATLNSAVPFDERVADCSPKDLHENRDATVILDASNLFYNEPISSATSAENCLGGQSCAGIQ